MQLAVIFIEPAIRSTDGHVAGLAILDTPAFRLVRVPVHHTLAAPATVLLLTGCMQAILSVEHWEEQKMPP